MNSKLNQAIAACQIEESSRSCFIAATAAAEYPCLRYAHEPARP
jgi:hypothetical protein